MALEPILISSCETSPSVGTASAATVIQISQQETGAAKMSEIDTEVNVLALVKGEERFIFLFDDANRDETLRQLARFASNPEIDFSWYDAAMLSQKIREAVPTDDDLAASEEFDSLSLDDF